MRYIALFLAVLLLAGCSAQTAQPSQTTQTTQPTQATELFMPMAPDFTAYDAQGNAVSLSDFRGKPVVLNFWASWCGPCKAEMPDFEEAYTQYGQQIHFVMVNLTDGRSETVATASGFLAQQGYTFPVYFDTDRAAAAAYGISSIPVTYFLNAKGQIVVMGNGRLDADSLQQCINMILE